MGPDRWLARRLYQIYDLLKSLFLAGFRVGAPTKNESYIWLTIR
ncbi:hypothetical protein LEP1GSC058_0523 [Leptospira fainei serovar Hurstbridge str. BUT 6]|uniref:Uncharacterized protein n=1 Tax=Leptospira fainei serovar Hurstbridge str. BUT 6 TaxID=1193011 RepID=S3W7N6_9LEPT|nr:hypothetical protein LEP1GSC058_0523 [Leptospira fainei serovar Hurstbridge str. BUT 6]